MYKSTDSRNLRNGHPNLLHAFVHFAAYEMNAGFHCHCCIQRFSGDIYLVIILTHTYYIHGWQRLIVFVISFQSVSASDTALFEYCYSIHSFFLKNPFSNEDWLESTHPSIIETINEQPTKTLNIQKTSFSILKVTIRR